jgi:hypothetical protein
MGSNEISNFLVPTPHSPFPTPYSHFSAIIGSKFVARRAGM